MTNVLITGGTSGIGYYCARELLRRNFNVMITGRDEEKGEQAARALKSGVDNCVTFRKLVLESESSVQHLADSISGEIDVVVANAGLAYTGSYRYTGNGIEQTFTANYLGHKKLIDRILSKDHRVNKILFTSSAAHNPSRQFFFPDPELNDFQEIISPSKTPKKGDDAGALAYANANYCIVHYAYELARRCGDNPKVNVFDPGLVPGTLLGRDINTFLKIVWYYLMPPLRYISTGISAPHQAGRRMTNVLTGVTNTGEYYYKTKKIKSSPETYDKLRANQLWEESDKLKLDP